VTTTGDVLITPATVNATAVVPTVVVQVGELRNIDITAALTAPRWIASITVGTLATMPAARWAAALEED
jgi:hypothetical protein